MGDFIPEVKLRFARLVAHTVREALKDPENRKDFEKWYLEHYGEPYVWRNIKGEVIVWDK